MKRKILVLFFVFTCCWGRIWAGETYAPKTIFSMPADAFEMLAWTFDADGNLYFLSDKKGMLSFFVFNASGVKVKELALAEISKPDPGRDRFGLKPRSGPKSRDFSMDKNGDFVVYIPTTTRFKKTQTYTLYSKDGVLKSRFEAPFLGSCELKNGVLTTSGCFMHLSEATPASEVIFNQQGVVKNPVLVTVGFYLVANDDNRTSWLLDVKTGIKTSVPYYPVSYYGPNDAVIDHSEKIYVCYTEMLYGGDPLALPANGPMAIRARVKKYNSKGELLFEFPELLIWDEATKWNRNCLDSYKVDLVTQAYYSRQRVNGKFVFTKWALSQ